MNTAPPGVAIARGDPHGSEPQASDAAEGFIRLASLEAELAAARARARKVTV